MKKRLLLMVLATTMTLSMLVGCGKEDSKDEATTPVTNVEQGSKDDSTNAPSKDDSTNAPSKDDSKDEAEEETKGYNEKYLDEPDWDAMYEKQYKWYVGRDNSEAEAAEKAQAYVNNEKLKYNIKKFVFEDMTKKFKNKEEFSPINGVHIYKKTVYGPLESFVCDVVNVIPEDDTQYKWFRDAYQEFDGFDVDKVVIQRLDEGNPNIVVKLEANYIVYKDFYNQSPMWVTVTLNQNEDGTFFYKDASFGYEFYEYIGN